MFEVFVGIWEKHVLHRDLNTSHKMLTGVDVEYLLKKLELNCSIVDLIDGMLPCARCRWFYGSVAEEKKKSMTAQ